MNSSNLVYDTCFSNVQNMYDKRACDYQLFKGQAVPEKNCRIDFGVVGGNNVSLYKNNLVDLESDLRGQTRFASSCPKYKYLPRFNYSCSSGLPSGNAKPTKDFIHLPECQIICRRPLCTNSFFVCTHCNTNEKDRC